ncbi:Adenylate cyclase [compost metagenome]
MVRDVSRFYSSSHDRFTYGSSFINFNLPQFYQIVKVDGRAQVIPFRNQVVAAPPMNLDENQPLLQQYFS